MRKKNIYLVLLCCLSLIWGMACSVGDSESKEEDKVPVVYPGLVEGSVNADNKILLKITFTEEVKTIYVGMAKNSEALQTFEVPVESTTMVSGRLRTESGQIIYHWQSSIDYDASATYRFLAQGNSGDGLANLSTDENTITLMPYVSGKFTPDNGENFKTLFIVGQDIDTVNTYTKDLTTSLAGTTLYAAGNGNGVYDRLPIPEGDLDYQAYAAGFKESALAIGLWMVGQEELIANEDAAALAAYHQVLEEFKAADRPVFLRLGYEVDGPWNHYEPEAFVKMWQYTHKWIQDNKAHNIALVWQLASYCAYEFDTAQNNARPDGADPNLGGNTYKMLSYDAWWPGDEYVDWTALSYFTQDRDCPGVDDSLGGLPDGFGKLSDVDSNGNSLALDNVMKYLKSKGKPVVISESSPKGYHLTELKYMSSTETDASKFIDITIEEIWDNWYKPYFAFLEKHKHDIRATAYINMEWNAFTHWNCVPGSLETCPNGYWGSAKVQSQELIKTNFLKELAKPMYLSAPSEQGFDIFNGWDKVTLVNRGQVPHTIQHIPHPIPGPIQAGDYDIGGEGIAYHDVDKGNNAFESEVPCRTNEDVDTGVGTCSVGWTSPGEWLEYTVNIAGGGENGTEEIEYDISVTAAHPDDGAVITMLIDGEPIIGEFEIPNTGDESVSQTVTKSKVKLPPGEHVLRVEMTKAGAETGNSGKLILFEFKDPNASQQYKEAYAAAIPGRIQFEEYNRGRAGSAFLDVSIGGSNIGIEEGCSRDDVTEADNASNPIRIAQHYESCSVSGAVAGEWMEYTVQVAETGTYDIKVRAIHGDNGGGEATYNITIDGTDVTGAIVTPATGDWSFVDPDPTVATNVNLTAGEHVMRINFLTNADNHTGVFDFVDFVRTTASNDTNQTAYQTNTISTTEDTVLQLGLFDLGGENVAWNDSSDIYHGTNSDCRTEAGVDETTDVNWLTQEINGTNVCSLFGFFAGEWVEYTITVPEDKTFNIGFVNSTGTAGSTAILDIGGVNLTSQPFVSTSTDWGDIVTDTINGASLTAGTHILRLTVSIGGLNAYQLKFTPVP